VYSFADFEQIGIDNPAEPSPPKAQDAACIMYTSGTTGDQLPPSAALTPTATLCIPHLPTWLLNRSLAAFGFAQPRSAAALLIGSLAFV